MLAGLVLLTPVYLLLLSNHLQTHPKIPKEGKTVNVLDRGQFYANKIPLLGRNLGAEPSS